MLRMDECTKIYKDFHQNGLNIHQISKKYNRSWDTIRKYTSISPSEQSFKQTRNRESKVITEELRDRIHQILTDEKENKVSRKHRYRSRAAFDLFVSEGIYSGAFRTFRRFFQEQKKLIYKTPTKSFVQLEFEFGQFLQVDHGPATVKVAGYVYDGYLFVASVPGEVLRYCKFYPTKATEAWGDFHEGMFNFFGGVFSKIIYDNDSVIKAPNSRKLTDFFVELQAHYGFEGIFCNKASGWEKGAVENAVGFCRRNYLPGLQEFKTFEVLNNYLETKSLENIKNDHHYETKRPLIENFNLLKSQLRPLNFEKVWGRWLESKVSTYQYITLDNHRYSVPENLVGARVRVFKTAFDIKVAFKNENVATHLRVFAEGEDSIKIDHFLDQLYNKPRALDYAKVFKMTKFSAPFLKMKEELRYKFDLKKANQEFINILKLKRKSTDAELEVAIELSLECRAISSYGVKSILHQLQSENVSTITEIESNHLKIDHHFNLNKYEELTT